MSTTADYLGRKYDVLAFPGAKAAGPALLSQDLLQNGGSICVGIQKLAQRWMLEFLTIRGSMRYLQNRGSDFVSTLRAGSLRTDDDVRTAFLVARRQVSDNLLAEETDNDPDDERYASADLTAVTIQTNSTVVLNVEIRSQAGTSRTLILPLTVGPVGV